MEHNSWTIVQALAYDDHRINGAIKNIEKINDKVSILAKDVRAAICTESALTAVFKERYMPYSNSSFRTAYGNNILLAVEVDGNRLWKFDGTRWKLYMLSQVTSILTDIYSIAYGAGCFMIVGRGADCIGVLYDGDNWTNITVNRNGTSYAIYDIEWTGEQFAMIPYNKTVIELYNPKTRASTKIDLSPALQGSIKTLSPVVAAYGNRKIIIMDAYINRVFLIFDLSNYKLSIGQLQTFGDTSTVYWSKIIYSDGIFIAIAQGTKYCAIYENDSWSVISMDSVPRLWHYAATGNGRILSVAYNSSIARVYRDNRWINLQLPLAKKWVSIHYCDGYFLALAPEDTVCLAIRFTPLNESSSVMIDAITNEIILNPSQTITHYAPIEDMLNTTINTSEDNDNKVAELNKHIGRAVFFTGNVYKRIGSKWYPSTENDTQDCIGSVKFEGEAKEYAGIVISVNLEYKSLTFATHGDYLFKVDDSSKYKVGDTILYNGVIVSDNAPITVSLAQTIIGQVTGIINDTTIAVFKT